MRVALALAFLAATDPATLDIQTAGGISAIRLDFAAGGSQTLTLNSPNRWSASIPAAKLLEGYASDDVNHNVVGFLRLLGSGGETLASLNMIIEVVDDRVPPAPIRDLGGNARATERIVNLYRPGIGINDVQLAAQQFFGRATAACCPAARSR